MTRMKKQTNINKQTDNSKNQLDTTKRTPEISRCKNYIQLHLPTQVLWKKKVNLIIMDH